LLGDLQHGPRIVCNAAISLDKCGKDRGKRDDGDGDGNVSTAVMTTSAGSHLFHLFASCLIGVTAKVRANFPISVPATRATDR